MSATTSAYKQAYLRHRRRHRDEGFKDDFPDLLDFSNPTAANKTTTSSSSSSDGSSSSSHQSCANIFPLQIENYIYKGPVYGIRSHPGFIYVPQAISKNIQMDLAYQALTEFCESPHRTNIDLVPIKESETMNGGKDTMWSLWKRENCNSPVGDCMNADDPLRVNHRERESVSQDKINDKQFESSENTLETQPRFYKTMKKLSWATTGYHYDWTERTYREELQSPMPLVLKVLGSFFASLDKSHDKQKFRASASIVNYYSLKSNMGGHKDDLEYDFTKPVVSINLGLAGVFLLGGLSKEVEPVVPILVRPGDVMLLGGESRLCYHGMARVIPDWVALPPMDDHHSLFHPCDIKEYQIKSWNDFGSILECLNYHSDDDDDDDFKDKHLLEHFNGQKLETPKSDLKAVEQFLSKHRLNINIRQVLPDGMKRIPCASI